jgi:hypothetical protein
MQHGGRNDRDGPQVNRNQFAKTIKQRACYDEPNPDPVLLGDNSQRPFDLVAQVPGNPIGRLCGAKSSMLGREPVVEVVEACLQPLGDQRFIQPWPKRVHTSKLRVTYRADGNFGGPPGNTVYVDEGFPPEQQGLGQN